MVDIKLLNRFSREFAELLFRQLPELEQYAVVDVESDERLKKQILELTPEYEVYAGREGWIGSLRVIVPAPEGNRIGELCIYTQGMPCGIVEDGEEYPEFCEDITVGVGGGYHTHFQADRECTEKEAFENAVEFIQDVLSEREVFIFGLTDGEANSGTTFRKSEGENVVVRSWKGTYDLGEG
jgi:hypothetical protein